MFVDLSKWGKNALTQIKSQGVNGAKNVLYDIYLAGFLSTTSRFSIGTNVFTRDWDTLIVLDACRVDALREVSDEYKFLNEIESIRSVGSYSHEWMAKTFTKDYRDEINNTAYVSGNPYISTEFFDESHPPANRDIPFGPSDYGTVSRDTFAYVDEIQTYGVDADLKTISPDTVTDRAIYAGREIDADRLIVHYMQPHDPFISNNEYVYRAFQKLRDNELTEERAWRLYLDTLRHVLDSIETLLENLTADKVIITADHGEAFGELGFYGHLTGFPHPAVKRVPWAETTSRDTGSYQPSVSSEGIDEEQVTLEDHLRHLGYR